MQWQLLKNSLISAGCLEQNKFSRCCSNANSSSHLHLCDRPVTSGMLQAAGSISGSGAAREEEAATLALFLLAQLEAPLFNS